jgi:hypothetical protein
MAHIQRIANCVGGRGPPLAKPGEGYLYLRPKQQGDKYFYERGEQNGGKGKEKRMKTVCAVVK